MKFTDLFIRRPVLATVVSLVILLLGLRAGAELNVRQYPELRNAQVTVTVAYPGAEASLMEGFVTTPLEREVATADGIDFLTSSTAPGLSTITANLRLTKDPNEALTEIAAKVNKLRNRLPEGSEDPVVAVAEGQSIAAMYISFYSTVLDDTQITDYLVRVVEPQLAAIPGIEKALILGAKTYALRVWLKPEAMAAHGLTASEVYGVIRNQNVLSAVGESKGNLVRIGFSAQTDLRKVEEFRHLIVKSDAETIVHLEDVADVELGSEEYDLQAAFDAQPAIFMGIEIRPDANVLDVIGEVRKVWPSILAALPTGLDAQIGYDSTQYIRTAISEVQLTLVEAVVIVIIVIFLFLGSVRSSLIPAVTVPLSLVGALFLMYLLGYTINLLTLLAMVLAIGMVVDDAIIVMENIHRHIEEGMTPTDAAIKGARELFGPVVAMTITLMAVYAPIGFLSGITGKLFSEFAFTLAGAVLISGVIALTLTPMMCARILKPAQAVGQTGGRLAEWLDARFESLRHGYKRRLHGALNTPAVTGVFGAVVLVSCYFLFVQSPSELAPAEDIGFAFSINEADGFATKEYFDQYFTQAQQLIKSDPEVENIFAFTQSANMGFIGMMFKPWSEREQTSAQIVAAMTPKMEAVSGIRWAGMVPPALPTPGQGYPVEFVIKSTADVGTLAEVGDRVLGHVLASKKFFFAAPTLQIDRPEAVIEINREKAALLGVDMQRLSADLSALLAGGEVNRFSFDGRSYRVIQQATRMDRLDPQQLGGYYTRTVDGQLIPLATLVDISHRTVPRAIEHFQQLNANRLIAVPRPDVSQGEALALFREAAAKELPDGFQIDYGGPSRQFMEEGSALLATFGFAILIIFLVLAAQFESFRDPLIMLVTVPMSICGALLGLNILGITNGMQLTHFPGMTLNIYTQVGLVTLIGVIAKHGILIVEFANKLQAQGLDRRAAIEEAASIRLRPVLMTTAALVVAMVPLLLATGPGAAARFSMGFVIATGMTIGTAFTLFVVPAVYLYLARDHRAAAALG